MIVTISSLHWLIISRVRSHSAAPPTSFKEILMGGLFMALGVPATLNRLAAAPAEKTGAGLLC
jgi:hypothetical protein